MNCSRQLIVVCTVTSVSMWGHSHIVIHIVYDNAAATSLHTFWASNLSLTRLGFLLTVRDTTTLSLPLVVFHTRNTLCLASWTNTSTIASDLHVLRLHTFDNNSVRYSHIGPQSEFSYHSNVTYIGPPFEHWQQHSLHRALVGYLTAQQHNMKASVRYRRATV